jgi:hypothetical protein
VVAASPIDADSGRPATQKWTTAVMINAVAAAMRPAAA